MEKKVKDVIYQFDEFSNKSLSSILWHLTVKIDERKYTKPEYFYYTNFSIRYLKIARNHIISVEFDIM